MADPNDTQLSDAVTKEFTAAGYKADHIATILARQESLKHERVRDQETWVTIHREHLLPETLDAYQLPWEWDEEDPNYIIIKHWFSRDVQEELFAHTRRLRKQRLDGLQADLGDYELIEKNRDRKRHDEVLGYFRGRGQKPKKRYAYAKGRV
ncbi:uncharacterized protein EURHEDRAFT_411523 [Aspergillus ruber CBS 135680]|uniref:Uncharacterized protein n=1 Tax=Aspergillus ruber (strain CBS 135680) TaxID=1388766 RepID=A0A017SHL8_ASPRC|nr:uncharacterized protein EURHEDRAFT_411523 [Aspergillus ruber CBS 135680]EYE95800.1 hypothetical protein EURHEDRAFT_411523 [Aspergillus ruber CBS 135680]